uniref:Nuclear receptor domain-containing protein n=1 Tax=Ditylenchus dipsaci TaxID=166011 RepID=A0A915DYQ9_9BILA
MSPATKDAQDVEWTEGVNKICGQQQLLVVENDATRGALLPLVVLDAEIGLGVAPYIPATWKTARSVWFVETMPLDYTTRGLQFSCKEDEKCEINKTTRNICQRCRLLKCISNGMSTELVLNEVERGTKRKLIERNRERRKIEKIQNQLRRSQSLSDSGLGGSKGGIEDVALVNALTTSYCNQMDVPLQMDSNFAFQDPSEQFNSLLKEILRRTFSFANSVELFTKLKPEEQECLLVKNRGWLEIQLLRAIHQVDVVDKCLVTGANSETSSSRTPLNEFCIEPTKLVHDLYTLAESFQKLQLDNSQLAVLSAIFVFQAEFLPENEEVANFSEHLWSCLQTLVEQSPALGDTPERMASWPRLHIKIAHLRATARRYFTAFFEKTNAREFLGCLPRKNTCAGRVRVTLTYI